MNTNKKTKKLGLLTLTSLVAGNMIGSGIFMLPADLARVGSISLYSWFFTAFGSILLALVFSKMSSIMPRTGGPYAYARSGFGNFIGFQLALSYWLAVIFSNAAVAIAFVGYLRLFFPILASPAAGVTIALIMIWLLTLVNVIGVHVAGKVQFITMLLKCGALLFVAILGWWYFHPEYITQSFNLTHKSNLSAFSYASTLTLWAFIGLESATIPAGNVHNPKRNIPLATMFGIGIAAILYIVSSTVIMGILPASFLANSTFPFAEAAKVISGKWGQGIIAIGALISCFGTLNGWILVQGQISMAIADDKLFPQIFAKRNRTGTPAIGIIIGSIIMSLFLLLTISPNLVDQFQFIILITTTAFLVTYFYTAIAEIIILRDDKTLKKNGKIKKNIFNVIVALCAAFYAFWAIFGAGREIIFYMMAFLFASIPLYALLRNVVPNRNNALD